MGSVKLDVHCCAGCSVHMLTSKTAQDTSRFLKEHLIFTSDCEKGIIKKVIKTVIGQKK